MYQTLIEKIRTTLQGVTAIKQIFSYPLAGAPDKYPAVVFFPDAVDNSFDSNAENAKVYRFRLWVVLAIAGTDENAVFTEALPNAVDQVLAAFDTGWDMETSTEGHRIWGVISSGVWGLSDEAKSKQAFAELVLTVRVNTDV